MKRELRRLMSRPIYLMSMVGVPIVITLFFVSLLDDGLPTKVPTAVVDLDNSTLSRQMIANLEAMQLIDVTRHYESYHNALEGIKRGEIYGFFMIPDDFEREAIASREPTITYYCNMAYYIPGTLSFKGFKTVAVSTAGGVVTMQLMSEGVDGGLVGGLIQPLAV